MWKINPTGAIGFNEFRSVVHVTKPEFCKPSHPPNSVNTPEGSFRHELVAGGTPLPNPTSPEEGSGDDKGGDPTSPEEGSGDEGDNPTSPDKGAHGMLSIPGYVETRRGT